MYYQIINHRHIFEPFRYFPQCHASTICMLPDETLVCAWFAGTKEGADDCAVWTSRRVRGRWTKPVRTAWAEDVPCWNPVLLYHKEKLTLFYKTGRTIEKWQTMIKESFDGGKTWGAQRELAAGDYGGRGPVKNKCLVLKNGRILAPASRENEKEWRCFTDISDDGGAGWHKSAEVPVDKETVKGPGMIQPSLWEGEDGLIHMLMRSTEGKLFESVSPDGGEHWETAAPTKLPNNNCGIDLVKMENGLLVLVCNPVSGNWAKRSPIAFLVSEDDGKTFGEPWILDDVPCEKNEIRAEFSYPAVISRGQELFITYTWKRRSIAFWQLRIWK